jgi:FkbM family methyltransferase
MAEMVKATLNGRWDIILPKHRADRPDWYTEKGWERKRLDSLYAEIVRQKSEGITPVVYYVGSEEGEMPALCQMWGADVIMFEPNPLVLPNIRAIWEANNLDMPLGFFVGFASSVTDLNPINRNPLATGFEKGDREWPEAAYGEVIGNHGFKELYQEADAFPQIKLDDVAKQFPEPTIITFDVEGSEWQVMRGAEKVMDKYKPTIFASISPEFMYHQYGEYSRDFRNWIIDHGYEEMFLDYEHELHTVYRPKEV